MLLPGASHPSAVIGNACGFLEMVEQFREQGLEPPRTVFITAATGNTIAGFLIAESALRAVGGDPIRIIGVQVYPGSVRQWTWLMLKWTRHFAGLAGRIRLSEIEIDASTILDGFGHFSDELAGVCARVERDFGFDIDPIFGGKTWHVMDTYRKDDRVSGPVLYWHCGYTPEWRALGSRIDQHRGVA